MRCSSVSVSVYGDEDRPALITYPDVALNYMSCFHGMFFCPEAAALLLHNFCIYHITPQGHELGAPPIPSDVPELSVDKLTDQVTDVLDFFGIGSVMCMGVTADKVRGKGSWPDVGFTSMQSPILYFNMALLASWSKRFFLGGDKSWITLVNHKYKTDKPNLLWSKPDVGSPFWKGVTWAPAKKKGKVSLGLLLELGLSTGGLWAMVKVLAYGRGVDKYLGYPRQGMCTDSPMEDIMCGRSICSTSALSPAAGPAKRRAATNRLEMKTWAGAGNGPGGFALRAHSS